MIDEGTLAVVSNRLPVRRVGSKWQAAVGGLVTALRPIVRQRAARWIGWDGGAESLPAALPGTPAELAPVSLSATEVRHYYDGFGNRTIWPLFHDNIETPAFHREWWDSYAGVNRRFADVCADSGDAALWWVHDYHLMLLPQMLRDKQQDAPISFFLHIPWPPPELFARLPWRREILLGLLGADVVTFHTEQYRKNFVRTCGRVLSRDEARAFGRTIELADGRQVHTAANPISIDNDDFADLAVSAEVAAERERLQQQFGDRMMLLGVDRLDYTKGIPQRLEAFERLLDRRPDLRTKLVLVQLAVPSRGNVSAYQGLRSQVEAIVGRINGRFTEPGHDAPVHYLHRGVPFPHVVASYCQADVMLVTPLKDGMNLVAKEFIITQAAAGRAGALVLSEFTGAALELREAFPCNPFDIEGLSHVLERAIAAPEDDRRTRSRAMARRLRRADVHRWARLELETAFQ
ncbi:MAG: trehalose-6-phosphate synthase [Egibacteraceae bacterium]